MKKVVVLLMCVCLLFASGCRQEMASVDHQTFVTVTELCVDNGGFDTLYMYDVIPGGIETDIYCNDGIKFNMTVKQFNHMGNK